MDTAFISRFETIAAFIKDNPHAAPKPKNNVELASPEHIEDLARKFVQGRLPRKPERPKTIPDELVGVILTDYFGEDVAQIESIKQTHLLSMAAENIVGDLLERYLASVLEPRGWIWCSGSVTRSIDFIKQLKGETPEWICLQIKNRDNSENSSSAAVRKGTDIEKWFRTFSQTGKTNWDAFPDETVKEHLSEERFIAFVKDYLRTL